MLIRQAYLNAKITKELEIKQQKAMKLKRLRQNEKLQSQTNSRRYFDDLGYDYAYDSSEQCPPGPDEAYDDEHVEYDWNDIAHIMQKEKARNKKKKKSRKEPTNIESDTDVMTEREMEELSKLNVTVNDDIQNALKARDSFTWDCIGIEKGIKVIRQVQHVVPEEEQRDFEGGNWEYKDDNGKAGKSAGQNADPQKKGLRKMKVGTNEELERRKKKALFGSRASSKIFDSTNTNNNQNWASGENQITTDIETKEQRKTCKEKIIIDSNSKWKAIFDVFIILLVAYSCITSMFYAAFTPTNNQVQKHFDNVVEGFFWVDLALNFLQSFKHPETYEMVIDLKQIAKNYVTKGWFFVDFISVFPFQIFLSETGTITKLFRLARLPRLIKLIDITRFNKLLKSLMQNSSRDEKIVAQYMLLYIYKIFRLIVIAIIITYFIGCFWWYFCNTQIDIEGQNSFIKFNELASQDEEFQLVVSCYYALTTLSTVGYGDYFPVSNMERIIAVIIMLCGVAFFSYIMGNFIEIISNYEQKMGVVDKSADLHNWLILLTRFTNNPSGLPKPIIDQIEENFSYYWAQDRLTCLNTEEEYLETLPRKIKNQIMTVYLFSDIFRQFKRFFNVDSAKESRFLYDVAFGFMPRNFTTNDDDKIIYDEEEDVPEMYFIIEGNIAIAFSLIANGFSNKQYQIGKRLVTQVGGQQTQGEAHHICDHYVVNQCKSQFIYMAYNKDVKCFALTKKKLHEEVFPKYPEIMSKIQMESLNLYNKRIFKPINEMRRQEIQNMNKKSVYRQIQLTDVKDKQQQMNALGIGGHQQTVDGVKANVGLSQPGLTEIGNKFIAEKMVSQNLKENVNDLQTDLLKISSQVKEMISGCENRLNDVMKQVDKITNNND